MSEKKLQIEVYIRFLFVFAFAALYAWGGIEYKWLRRFVAPAVLTSGMFLFSRDWRTLLQTPLMMASLSLGYGGTDNVLWKIVKRGFYGLANGFTSSSYNLYLSTKNSNLWTIVSLQVILCILTIIVLGVWNPIPARAEEFCIGVFISLLPIMSIHRKELNNGN